jgi:hypothetical protein
LAWIEPLLVDLDAHSAELARFESNVVRGPGADDCAIWVGAIGADGYGRNQPGPPGHFGDWIHIVAARRRLFLHRYDSDGALGELDAAGNYINLKGLATRTLRALLPPQRITTQGWWLESILHNMMSESPPCGSCWSPHCTA